MKQCDLEIRRISEIFNSWQGEGPRMGQQATFIRFKYCNLKCPFCDTQYKFENKKPVDVTCKNVHNHLQTTNYLVITGGEPLLHPNELSDLFKCIKEYDENIIIGIETNGYREGITKLYDILSHIKTRNDKLEIYFSPKVFIDKYKDSGNTIREFQDSLLAFMFTKEFSNIPVDIYIKIVVSDVIQVEPLIELSKQILPNKHIYLMPEGKTKEELIESYQKTIQLAKQYNVNISDRLQVNFGII